MEEHRVRVVVNWEGVACLVALVAGAAAVGLAVAAEAGQVATAVEATVVHRVEGWVVSVGVLEVADRPVARGVREADAGWPAGAPPRRGECTDPRCERSVREAGEAVGVWAAGQWGTAAAAGRAAGPVVRVGASVLSWLSSAVRSSRGG